MLPDEGEHGACCSFQCASPGCAEGIEDPTCRWEGSQGIRPLVVGSAADEACSQAGGTGRPASGDRTAGLDVVIGGEVDGGGGR